MSNAIVISGEHPTAALGTVTTPADLAAMVESGTFVPTATVTGVIGAPFISSASFSRVGKVVIVAVRLLSVTASGAGAGSITVTYPPTCPASTTPASGIFLPTPAAPALGGAAIASATPGGILINIAATGAQAGVAAVLTLQYLTT